MIVILETGVKDFTTEQLAKLMDDVGRPIADHFETIAWPGIANSVRVCWMPTGYAPRLHINLRTSSKEESDQIDHLFNAAMGGLKRSLDHMLFDEETKKRATISWG
jgi:hypothetical protein